MRQPCEMTRCDVMCSLAFTPHTVWRLVYGVPLPGFAAIVALLVLVRSARLPAELDLGRVGRIIPPCTRLFHACTVITGHVKYYQTLLCILRVPRYLECIWGNLPMDCLAEYYRSTLARLAMCWALRIMYCMCNVVFIGQGL